MTDLTALLLLTDSRLPAGGHVYSGGVEEAVLAGAVRDTDDLRPFLDGRLSTVGLAAAALCAAACGHAHRIRAGAGAAWPELDAEADARISSPASRQASRAQGRLLLRAGRGIWPSVVLDDLAGVLPGGPHHPVVLGAVAAVAGTARYEAALAAAYGTVTGPATAAVRLLGLDPVTVHHLLAELTPALALVARRAVEATEGAAEGTVEWRSLPAPAAPGLDLLAERHQLREVRLFAS